METKQGVHGLPARWRKLANNAGKFAGPTQLAIVAATSMQQVYATVAEELEAAMRSGATTTALVVDDAMVERFCADWWHGEWPGRAGSQEADDDLRQMVRRSLTAALTANHAPRNPA